ncbi:hypothetical protein [Pseudoalteromonas sp. Of7M-16]|uniref:hypothetical protein n=1 Tax=Pseudoalteromonas sp. Of7M-16 TaxID=2917756 RepID=UPI001EF71FB9|nr:hypothetical protein [Pseudoalteromonas sp. Of7M-16]MCG7549216.1 hypothetical protein [Pseudoalteromonas sp. Of7M-16]
MESIFKLVKVKQEPTPKGYIKYYGLTRWWTEELEHFERKRIRSAYKPLGLNKIDEGEISKCSQSRVNFLKILAGYFRSSEGDYDLCLKILNKAEMSIAIYTKTSEIHLLYGRMMEFYYRNRNLFDNYNKAKHYAQLQIKLAPKAISAFKAEHRELQQKAKQYGTNVKDSSFILPSHAGYNQLAVIYKKEKNWLDLIELCDSASNQGWPGNWEQLIDDAKSNLLI